MDTASKDTRPWRGWYKLARWLRLREWQLSREPLCRYCLEVEDVTEADTVDHTKPHKGDPALFWNTDNLQSLCKPCHDRHKQREERGTERPPIGLDGYPIGLDT